MKIITTYNEDLKLKWNSFLDSCENPTFFQTPDCFQLYSNVKGMEPFVFAFEENNQLSAIVCGYLTVDKNKIRNIFTRRAIIPGGILVKHEISERALRYFLNELRIGLCKMNAIYIEMRNYNSYDKYLQIFNDTKFFFQPHLNIHVITPDVESATKKLSSTKRRDIRLTEKNGAIWYLSSSEEDMKSYYKILSELYKTRIKTPLFDFSFFSEIVKNDYCRFFVVKYEDEVIGGSLCVELESKVLYEWFVCGKDGQIKNVFPSTVATWAAIEYAAKKGLSHFDMMGAGKPNESYGVRDFKLRFGGELVEHGRFLYVCNPLLYFVGKKVVSLLKKGTK